MKLFLIFTLFLTINLFSAAVLKVGPSQTLKNISTAAQVAQSGDIVQIDSGDYFGDVAVWLQLNLTIQGIGQVRLFANGKSAEGKAIWVIRNGIFNISNIHFYNCSVADHNGAGIRFENGSLTVTNCSFLYNEDGILTANLANMVLIVINCEFGYTGAGDGFSHNIYVGQIQRFYVSGSYFHHARIGHLIKSRASQNFIYYNRITDELGGTASYEIDLPNGGTSYIVGNLIEQSATSTNHIIITHGEEVFIWSNNNLTIAQNTIVNDYPSGTFLVVANTSNLIDFSNNILVGSGGFTNCASLKNFQESQTIDFANSGIFDYHLLSTSSLLGKAYSSNVTVFNEYSHPLNVVSVQFNKNPGAFQNVTKASGAPSLTINVGPTRNYKNISAVATAAPNNSIIQIDSGDYYADVAFFNQNNITIIGNGQVRLFANGASAGGKAIWVVSGGSLTAMDL